MTLPFRRIKIGRNAPCYCGSGKKFKRCHGNLAKETLAPASIDEVFARGRDLLEKHKIQELQRQQQQGLGRPIISIEFKDFRFVAVGRRLYHGKWKTFFDFLNDYIKSTIGSDGWGNAELAKPVAERHQILHWYGQICDLQQQHKGAPGQIFSMPMTGAASAYHRLAYNLYLIAHNVADIETRLIARLRNADNFQGAFYETQVAAWLIKAGFELEFENEADGETSHCEFTATYVPTGEKFSVEAKSRAFIAGQPRRLPVGRLLTKALKKNANFTRLVFIEMNRPIFTEQDSKRTLDRAQAIIKAIERNGEAGIALPKGYVCITNTSDQHDLDGEHLPFALAFFGFHIPDFVDAKFTSIRSALAARRKHWPMFHLLQSIKKHSGIPSTFDGKLPSVAFQGKQEPRLQVGNIYQVTDPDGVKVAARLTTATVIGKDAICAFYDPPSDKGWIQKMPMSEDELRDYAMSPSTYFGVYQEQNRQCNTPIELFDFFFESYSKTPKAKLLEFMARAADLKYLETLDQKDLAEIFCERSVYSVWQEPKKA